MPQPIINNVQVSQNSITVYWTLADRPDHVQIQVGIGGGTFGPIDNISPTTTSYTITEAGGYPIRAGTTYSVAVCSVYRGSGARSCSTPKLITTTGSAAGGGSTTNSAPIITGAPVPLPQTLYLSNAIQISWDLGYDAYNVIWRTRDLSTQLQSPELDSTTNSFVCFPTAPKSLYFIAIEGKKNGQWSPWCPFVNVTAGPNLNDLRAFLQASHVDGSNGIRPLLPTSMNPSLTNLRAIMGI